MVKFQTAPAYAGTRRVTRSPKHTFSLKHKPYVIQPFMIAPVLPGETMKNLLMQARVVSDPIKSPLVGWWIDYIFVYVKHRDLDERDFFTDMMLNPDWSPDSSIVASAANQELYTFDGALDWVRLCLKKTVEDLFRYEGETWDQYKTAGGMPLAKIDQENYLNSLAMGSVAEVDVDVDANEDSNITASEVDKALKQWQLLRLHNLTDMTYEDYLRSFGVRSATVDLHRVEVLRVIREWTYPTNTINPANGAPSTAVSWSLQERADKDRYFKEPGFIFGVTVARPKIYFDNLKGAGAGLLAGALPWLPALQADWSDASLLQIAESAGPVPNLDGTGDSYWIDVRDLFIYGDQFVNHTDDSFANAVPLPGDDGQWRYPTEAIADALFVNAGDSGALYVKQDGIVSLSILGRQVDTTPGQPVQEA